MLGPPKSSDKLSGTGVSGSATGNPRNKVALQPGHSLMDWIRLGHSGKDLTGVGGVVRRVTPAELATHNKPTDCWLAIRGTVYNVTPYMNFHPGGPEKLMEGAGKDATEIFDKIHAYVNYSSILQKCVVGTLCQTSEIDITAIFSSGDKPKNRSDFQKPPPRESITSLRSSEIILPLDWYQKDDTIHIVLYTKISNPQVLIQLKQYKELWIYVLIKSRAILSHINLFNKVKWPCQLYMNDIGKVEVELKKAESGKWTTYGKPYRDSGVLSTQTKVNIFRKLIVVDSIEVTHNTRLIILRYEDQIYNSIPVGHHILINHKIEGTTLERMYTPVPPMLHADHTPPSWSPDCLCLMVKGYPNSAVSSWLAGLRPEDSLEIGGPEGTFSVALLKDCTQLYLIAAGTGLTPMLGLTSWALDKTRRKCINVSLLFFNRTFTDILWREQMEHLANTDSRFSARHVLSEPDADWTGSTGRVTTALLKTFLPEPTPESPCFVGVCGPSAFTQLTRECLENIGYTESQYHCFLG